MRSYRLAVLVLIGLCTGSAFGQAQFSSGFTYQGRLNENGVPATGQYDFQFNLHSNFVVDTPVGPTLTLENVQVTDGLFTVKLDFGYDTTIWNNNPRWLVMKVRPGASSGAFTTLSPKQELTPAPFAMGLRLPYASAFNLGTSTAFSIVNNGGGTAGYFRTNHFLGTSAPALYAEVGGGTGNGAVHGKASSENYAGYFDGRGYFSGNVGIGTDSPSVRLVVAGDSDLDAFTGGSMLITSPGGFLSQALFLDGNEINCLGTLTVQGPGDTGDLVLVTGGGNVGIGDETPDVRLHVNGGTDSEPTGGGFVFIGSGTGTHISIDNNEIMALNNTSTSTLYLNHNGGDVQVSQGVKTGKLITPVLQITGGSDLSEQFDVADLNGAPVEAGSIVCIDEHNPGKLIACTRAYDKRVAGVVSGAGGVHTGMLMGQEDSVADGGLPIALTGRVYCRVDASNGAIEAGDLLTTSATPGYAMKATDDARSHGAIIGKAMTSLSEDKGLVLVLVALH